MEVQEEEGRGSNIVLPMYISMNVFANFVASAAGEKCGRIIVQVMHFLCYLL